MADQNLRLVASLVGVEKVESGLKRIQGGVRETARQSTPLRREFHALREIVKPLGQEYTRLGEETVKLGRGTGSLIGVVGALGAAAVLAGEQLAKMAAAGVELKFLSREAGISVQNIKALEHVFERFNIPAERADETVKTFANSMYQLRQRVGIFHELAKQGSGLDYLVPRLRAAKDNTEALGIAMDEIARLQKRGPQGEQMARHLADLLGIPRDVARFAGQYRAEMADVNRHLPDYGPLLKEQEEMHKQIVSIKEAWAAVAVELQTNVFKGLREIFGYVELINRALGVARGAFAKSGTSFSQELGTELNRRSLLNLYAAGGAGQLRGGIGAMAGANLGGLLTGADKVEKSIEEGTRKGVLQGLKDWFLSLGGDGGGQGAAYGGMRRRTGLGSGALPGREGPTSLEGGADALGVGRGGGLGRQFGAAGPGHDASVRSMLKRRGVGGARGPSSPLGSDQHAGAAGQHYNYFQRMGARPLSRDQLQSVETPYGKIAVHPQAAGDFKSFFDDLKGAGAPLKGLGSYNMRQKRWGGGWSSHAYGAAVDLDDAASLSPAMRGWISSHQKEWQEALAKHNLGQPLPQKDAPHIEWRGPGTKGPSVGQDKGGSGGAGFTTRGSTFDDARTASGLPRTVPGIALPSRTGLGKWFKVRGPNGQEIVVRQTDVGPAKWTGRGVDINRPAAGMMGYSTKNFPTDSKFHVEPLGDSRKNAARRGMDSAMGGEMRHKVEGSGHIDVHVKAPPGTKVDGRGRGIFRSVNMRRSVMMQPSLGGPSAFSSGGAGAP